MRKLVTVMKSDWKFIHIRIPVMNSEWQTWSVVPASVSFEIYTRTREIPARKRKGKVIQEATHTDQVIIEISSDEPESKGLLIRLAIDAEDLHQILSNFEMYKQPASYRDEI